MQSRRFRSASEVVPQLDAVRSRFATGDELVAEEVAAAVVEELILEQVAAPQADAQIASVVAVSEPRIDRVAAADAFVQRVIGDTAEVIAAIADRKSTRLNSSQ